jgi:hypothetical protein
MAQPTRLKNAASKETLLFTGLNKSYKRAVTAMYNAVATRPVAKPSRNKDSCARMLFAVAAASPSTARPLRKSAPSL